MSRDEAALAAWPGIREAEGILVDPLTFVLADHVGEGVDRLREPNIALEGREIQL
jgi:hypothetical protein